MYIAIEALDADPSVTVAVSLRGISRQQRDLRPAELAMLVVPTVRDDVRTRVTGARRTDQASPLDTMLDSGNWLEGLPVPSTASVLD